jgi:hypothetical protein
MYNKDIAAAKQVRNCRVDQSRKVSLAKPSAEHTQVTKKFCRNLARGRMGTTNSDMIGIR